MERQKEVRHGQAEGRLFCRKTFALLQISNDARNEVIDRRLPELISGKEKERVQSRQAKVQVVIQLYPTETVWQHASNQVFAKSWYHWNLWKL